MTISVELNDKDAALIKSYANLKNITVSDLITKVVLEQIEDEYDLQVYEKSMEEYKKNPLTYSLENIEKELALI